MRRLGHKTRVAMHRDHSGGVIGEDRASHLPRMHGRALNVAVEELLVPEVAMARVQEYETEHFSVQHSIVQGQPLLHPLGIRQDLAGLEFAHHLVLEDHERLGDDRDLLGGQSGCARFLERRAIGAYADRFRAAGDGWNSNRGC